MTTEACCVEGCETPARTKRLCWPHYQRWWKRNRKTTPTRTCEIDGCDKPHRAKGMCSTHYNRSIGPARRHSLNAKPSPTDRRDPVPQAMGTWVAGRCHNCGAWFLAQRSRHWPRWCSKPCEARFNHTTRRAREAGAEGAYSAKEFAARVALLDGCCAYCSRRPARLHADHVIPLCDGGTNYIENIAPACSMCNQQKGSRSVAEWNALRARRGQSERVLDARLLPTM